jgi:hypothetical protein
MYIDNFRGFGEEDTNLDDASVYELETYDLPYGCPYRQMVPYPPFFGGQGPQFPQGGPPFGQGQQGAPTSPPPGFTPTQTQSQISAQQGPGIYAVDPGAIRPCTFRFVFIWPRRRRGFWAWLTFVGRRSVAGFRWTGRTWRYFGMDLRNIESFQCY